MKHLFVSFNDSSRNPTYAAAIDCSLIGRNTVHDDRNPCAIQGTRRVRKGSVKVPLIPINAKEIRLFADLMGWSVETDNEGQLILYTGKK